MRIPLGLSLLLLFLGACKAPTARGVIKVNDNAEEYRLRYLDGQVSLNTRCGVRIENGLNTKVRPLYVNGAPIGFC